MNEPERKLYIFPEPPEDLRRSATVGFMNAEGELVMIHGWGPEDGTPEWAVDWRTFGADHLLDAFNLSTNAQRFQGRRNRCVFCGRGRRRCRCEG